MGPSTAICPEGGNNQGRIFIFGALGYFKKEVPLEGLRRLMSYKSALHVLTTFTEQVVPIHKHISEFPRYSETEPCQLTSIPPIGGHAVTGTQIQGSTPQTNFQPPKFKYETL